MSGRQGQKPKGYWKKTKTYKCLQWLLKNPGATRQQAVEAGWKLSTYHAAISIMRGKPNEHARRIAAEMQATGVETQPRKPKLSERLDRVSADLAGLREEGLSYLHFEDGRVTIRMHVEQTWRIDGEKKEG